MADPSRAHGQAIHALAVQAGYPMFFGKVTAADTDLEYPYGVVWPPPARRDLITMAGRTATATTTTQISVVGRDPVEVAAALDRIDDQLVGVRPDIEGRRCSRIASRSPGQVPIRDDTTRTPDGQPVYMAVGLYELTSTPAA